MSFDMQEDGAARFQASFSSSAQGAQHNNLGPGNQYNNSSSGTQYNADNISFFNQKKDTFLADLRVTDPRSDKTRIERTKGNLLKDSYSWILENNDFRQWRSEKRLLWIKGSPGKGKTMLLCGVIDELQAMGYKSTFFFFCQATDARLNNATSVLRGLLFSILDQNPHLLKLVREKYDKAGAGIFNDINTWDVLCEMLVSVVSHESLRDVILVVDALDECTTDLDQLISFIIVLAAHARIIVSSRLWLAIDRGLAIALEDMKIYLSLELNEDVISIAVNAYINYKVNQLAALKGLEDDVRTKVRDYLVTKANSTFLWVSLVHEQLADNRVARRHTLRKLNEFPPGLDALYHRILTQLLQLQDAEHCREVLAVMSIVSRPLDLQELASLLHQVKSLGDIVEECGSLLITREGVIYFIHQSAKDFLLRHSDMIMPLGIAHNHNFVLSRLLQSLSDTLQRNIYSLTTHGIILEEIQIPVPDPLKPIRYACVHWADHFIEENAERQHYDEVYSFITGHFLYWLESLSLLRSMSKGILCMSRVQQIIEASTEPYEGKLLVRDALRFIRYFRFPIEMDPMQGYLSALVFSPMDNLVRGSFQHEEPKWPVKPMANDHLIPCLQTLEGHKDSVTSVAFSANDYTIASACCDGTVKIWDGATGQHLRTLITSGRGRSVALSVNGATLATVSDVFIELRSTLSGHCENQLYTIGSPLSVAFSVNGVTLASGSDDCVVQLWNSNTGRHLDTLTGHLSRVNSVAFSGDGSLVASASEDETVRLWRADAGLCVKTIQHNRPVRSVALSYDGSRIASAIAKCIWDGLRGSIREMKGDHVFCTGSTIAISSDGTQVAVSGDSDNGVELISLSTRPLSSSRYLPIDDDESVLYRYTMSRHRLSGHYGPVMSVAFCKKGSLLASASSDATIKLWDFTLNGPNLGYRPAISSVASLLDSNSGKGSDWGLDSYSYSNSNGESHYRQSSNKETVDISRKSLSLIRALRHRRAKRLETELWVRHNLRPGDYGGHSHYDRIHSLCLASHACRLISVSRSQTTVWDAQTGGFQEKCNKGAAFACSATIFEGHIHVAETYGNQIRITDQTTGRLLRTLEVERGEENLMVFSYMGTTSVAYPRRKIMVEDSGITHVEYGSGPIELWVTSIRFSMSGYKLHTNFGTIDLEQLAISDVMPLKPSVIDEPYSAPERYHLQPGGSWIVKDGRRFLWLPPEYRSDVIAIYGSTVVLGCSSGEVLFMRFS